MVKAPAQAAPRSQPSVSRVATSIGARLPDPAPPQVVAHSPPQAEIGSSKVAVVPNAVIDPPRQTLSSLLKRRIDNGTDSEDFHVNHPSSYEEVTPRPPPQYAAQGSSRVSPPNTGRNPFQTAGEKLQVRTTDVVVLTGIVIDTVPCNANARAEGPIARKGSR